MTLLKIKHKRQRIRRKIIQEVKVYRGSHNLMVNIPTKIVKNLKIEKGDTFRFITDRKRRYQSFEIIKKDNSFIDKANKNAVINNTTF